MALRGGELSSATCRWRYQYLWVARRRFVALSKKEIDLSQLVLSIIFCYDDDEKIWLLFLFVWYIQDYHVSHLVVCICGRLLGPYNLLLLVFLRGSLLDWTLHQHVALFIENKQDLVDVEVEENWNQCAHTYSASKLNSAHSLCDNTFISWWLTAK